MILLFGQLKIFLGELLPMKSQQHSMVNQTTIWLHQVTYQRFPLEPLAMIDALVQVETKHPDEALYIVE
jgi:hypothetical protein